MLETIPSAALRGLEAYRVRVEVAITRGTPMIQMVGLPASAVREGKERIRAAAANLGLRVPGLRITVNLAPAGVRKGGAAFDLPILVGILAAWGDLPGKRCRRWAMVGELGLDGGLRPVRGALPIALHARSEEDLEGLVLPRANLGEARPIVDFPVVGAESLSEVLAFLRGEAELPRPADLPVAGPAETGPDGAPPPDLTDVVGQEGVKRALEVAAAGGHNLLLRGVPGAGKTMLARRLPGLLPELTLEDAMEVTSVHSVAGRLPAGAGLVRRRPFRSPHHTVSPAGLVGGGSIPRPGEASLAHRGVLFLDELPEFGRASLEALRQPMEEGTVTLVRARASLTYPARFHLVAAMNPCPCGHYTGAEERCTCDPAVVRRYAGRVSGPLLDRIDLQVDVPRVRWEKLREGRRGEPTDRVRARVREARQRAARRLADLRDGRRPDRRTMAGRREGNAPRPDRRVTAGRAEGNGTGPDTGSEGHGSRSAPAGEGSGVGPGKGGASVRPAPPAVNASLTPRELERVCQLDAAGEALLRRAVERYGLSVRGYHRVLRVARTVADLAGSDRVTSAHVAEAGGYRVLDRGRPEPKDPDEDERKEEGTKRLGTHGKGTDGEETDGEEAADGGDAED